MLIGFISNQCIFKILFCLLDTYLQHLKSVQVLCPHHHLCQSINSAVSVCTVCFYLEASLVLSVSVLFSLHFSVITVAVKWCQRTDSSCQTPKQTGMSRSIETINNREAEINTAPQWPHLRKPECLQPCRAFVMWCGTDVSALSLPVHITAYQHPPRDTSLCLHVQFVYRCSDLCNTL